MPTTEETIAEVRRLLALNCGKTIDGTVIHKFTYLGRDFVEVLVAEIDRLKAHNLSLAERVEAQSELLTKAATNPYALAEAKRISDRKSGEEYECGIGQS